MSVPFGQDYPNTEAWADRDGTVHRDTSADDERTKTNKVAVRPPVADPVMYCGILGDIVAAADPTTEADPVGVFVSLLASVGAVIGGSPHLKIGNTRHPLLIWPLLFGRTGSGRKGEATDTAQTFVRSAVSEASTLFVTGLSSGEGLIERIRDVRDENDDGGTEDKRLLVVEPEFAVVMSRSRREGNTLGQVLREAWSGKGLATLNRRATVASSSHVAIVGHITPREFRLRLAETDMAGGTYNRFMPFYVERSKRIPIPDGVDEATVATLAAELRKSVDQARQRHRIQLDRAATRLWSDELYDEFTAADDEDEAWTEFARRAAPYALRVAGLHAALDDRNLISKDDLTAAAATVRYSVGSARFALDSIRRDPKLDRISRALDGAGKTGLSRRAISALFSRNLTKEVLDTLLDELSRDGDYQRYYQPTGGRPAEMWRKTT